MRGCALCAAPGCGRVSCLSIASARVWASVTHWRVSVSSEVAASPASTRPRRRRSSLAQVFKLALHLGAGFLGGAGLDLVRLGQPLFKLRGCAARSPGGCARPCRARGGPIALAPDILEQVLHILRFGVDKAPGAVDDCVAEAQAVGDGERVAPPRHADHQAVGGLSVLTSNSTEAFSTPGVVKAKAFSSE